MMFLLLGLLASWVQFSFYSRLAVELGLVRLKRNLKTNLFPALRLLDLSWRNVVPAPSELTIDQPAMAGTQLLRDRPEPEKVYLTKFDVLRT
jgi:hypothetical protein